MAPTEVTRAATKLAQVSGARRTCPLAQEPGFVHEIAGLLIRVGAGQQLIPLRDGKGSQPILYEVATIAGPSSPGSSKESAVAEVSPDGVSALLARVLNQLTLSAWLPAGLFAASVAVLLQFRSARSVDILGAVQALTANPIRVFVLMIPLFVITMVLTQAFSFESIRTLEGYWHRRGPASLVRTLMIRRHVRRKENIIKCRHRASEVAFYAAKTRMLERGIPSSIVNAFEAQVLNAELPRLTEEENNRFNRMSWRTSCDAWRLAKVDHFLKEETAYPAISRILPTKLGNLIRATEDRLQNAIGDVEGFALRRHAMVPRRVQMQHDQFRNRLQMFCTLIFVSVSLLVLTPIILVGSGIDVAKIVIISGSFAALSAASYRAAIASAGGYCTVLKQMDETYRTLDRG